MISFNFGNRYESVVPITYTETTHDGDETYKTEMKIGEIKTNDLLWLQTEMRKICSDIRI